jgi:uncharacterized protein
MYLWNSTRRLNAWSEQCRLKYGGRIQKVSVNAGFSCPNRDGTVGFGGCTFCDNEGFNPSYCKPEKSITRQIDEGLTFLRSRYPRTSMFVAYFQAYTNTHAPLETLKILYNEALSHPDISGIVIGTRPDAVNNDILDYIASLSHETNYVKVEYGLESCYDDTLQRINRGHSFADSRRTIELTAARGIDMGVHLIFGLPGEERERMLDQVHMINRLPINSIKFHQLQIVKGTVMAQQYREHPEAFELFSLNDYLVFMVRFIEQLRPDIVVERISGEVPLPYNEGISWGGIRADQVMVRLEEKLVMLDTWQGKFFRDG